MASCLGHYANACKSPKKAEVTDAAASKASTAAVAKAEDTSKEKKKKARKKRKPKPSKERYAVQYCYRLW